MWEWIHSNWPNAELPWWAFVVFATLGVLLAIPLSRFFNRMNTYAELLKVSLDSNSKLSTRIESQVSAPMLNDLEKVVAERQFVCQTQKGETGFRLEIGEPTHDVGVANGTDWRCPIRITLGADKKMVNVSGVDSLQALQLALQHARVEVEAIARRPGTTLKFLGENVDAATPDWSRNPF